MLCQAVVRADGDCTLSAEDKRIAASDVPPHAINRSEELSRSRGRYFRICLILMPISAAALREHHLMPLTHSFPQHTP